MGDRAGRGGGGEGGGDEVQVVEVPLKAATALKRQELHREGLEGLREGGREGERLH
jgi:hypothetical protein